MPGFIKPQLAMLKSQTPKSDEWLHEIKRHALTAVARRTVTFFARWQCRRVRPVARRVLCVAPDAALLAPCVVPVVVLFARFAVPVAALSPTSARL
jgi:hypothetical protein